MPDDLASLTPMLDKFLEDMTASIERLRREIDLIRGLAVTDPLEHDIATLDEVAWTLNHWRASHDRF